MTECHIRSQELSERNNSFQVVILMSFRCSVVFHVRVEIYFQPRVFWIWHLVVDMSHRCGKCGWTYCHLLSCPLFITQYSNKTSKVARNIWTQVDECHILEASDFQDGWVIRQDYWYPNNPYIFVEHNYRLHWWLGTLDLLWICDKNCQAVPVEMSCPWTYLLCA